MVYLDDREILWSGRNWSLIAEDLHTRTRFTVATADPSLHSVLHADRLIPTVALSGSSVIWTSWLEQKNKLSSFVSLCSLQDRRVRTLARVYSPRTLADVALFGHEAAWSQINQTSKNGTANATSTLWLYDTTSRILSQLPAPHGASELNMSKNYLVYKGSPTRYETGDVYLYDLRTRRTRALTAGGATSEPETPSVGASLVTWSSLAHETVAAYDLAQGRLVKLRPETGGRPFTAGSLLIYVAPRDSTNPQRGFQLVIDRLR